MSNIDLTLACMVLQTPSIAADNQMFIHNVPYIIPSYHRASLNVRLVYIHICLAHTQTLTPYAATYD